MRGFDRMAAVPPPFASESQKNFRQKEGRKEKKKKESMMHDISEHAGISPRRPRICESEELPGGH